MSNSNLNQSKNGNRFRLGKGGKSHKRGISNIFDGNKLAGSSAFGKLGDLTSKLGNSGNFFDNFKQNRRKLPVQ
jgi:hypothetical protein